jgi:hypothetical protein
MMIVVVMLIYTVSLKFQSPTSVIIHNQCLNIELISPVYFGNGTVYHGLSDQQIDINAAIKIRLEINATQDEFEGALLYKLQMNFHNPHDMDVSTTETHVMNYSYMLVAWKMRDSEPFVHIVLIEYTEKFVWNEDKLKKLYDKSCDRLKKYDDIISDAWIIDDNMTLKTVSKIENLETNFELNISISEEEKKDHAVRSLCLDLER